MIHPLVVAAMVGALSGTHAAIWGMYRDSIYEGFSPRRFLRSIIVGTATGIVLQVVLRLRLQSAASLLMLFGLAYAAERAIVETWKTFFRTDEQSQFFIPMPSGIEHVSVASRGVRIGLGIVYIVGVSCVLLAIAQLDRAATGPLTCAKSVFAGLLGGAMIAASRAWRDVQNDGYETLEFSDRCGEWHPVETEKNVRTFRTVALTVTFAVALSSLTDSYLYVAVASTGYERAAVETWRTLLAREKPPARFAGWAELHPEMRARRRQAIPPFVVIVVLVILTAGFAISP